MQTLRRQVSSPTALFAFESVARNKSFKQCALELNVTQPAVSYQIKQLEAHLGTKVFERQGRAISLTPSGEQLYAAVSHGFKAIQDAIIQIRRKSNDHMVTLCLSTALASHVLLPRLPSFRVENPDIDLNLKIVDRDVDPHSEFANLTVRLGHGSWGGMESWKLFDEVVYPVCSRDYLETHGPFTSLEALSRSDLLHLEEPYRERISWQEWFENLGCPPVTIEKRLQFSDHQLVLEAAIGGQGVALGWWHIADFLVERGLLVRPVEARLTTDQAFYVVSSRQDLPLPDPVKRTKDWILSFSSPGPHN